MEILTKPILMTELKPLAEKMFGNLVKAVVDVEREMMALDGEFHSDLAELLVENGSAGNNLWGIDIHPEIAGDGWLEFDSMINLKPQLGNRTRGVDDSAIKEKIIRIASKFIKK